MSAPGEAPVFNDAYLYKAVTSGTPRDFLDVIRLANYRIDSFSPCAVNCSLIQACHKGQKHFIQYLLQDGSRLEIRDDHGNTPLLICSEKGLVDIVDILLTMGANVNAFNMRGESALMLSIKSSGCRETTRMLLNRKDLNIDQQDFEGCTSLMRALEHLDLEAAVLLINMGACHSVQRTGHYLVNYKGETMQQVADRLGIGKVFQHLTCQKEFGVSPLISAALNRDLESFNFMQRCNVALIQEAAFAEKGVLTRMLSSIFEMQRGVSETEHFLIQKLLEMGINVNDFSKVEGSPIFLAVQIGDYRLVELICTFKPLIPHDVLVSVVKRQSPELIPLLVCHGAEINKRDEDSDALYGGSALNTAFQIGDIGCVNMLLYHGAYFRVDLALSEAVDNQNKRSLRYLVDHCAEEVRNLIANQRPDIFHTAVIIGDMGVLKILTEAGVDVDCIHDTKTPLMNAVDLNTIKYLLKNRADVNRSTGNTALLNAVSETYLKSVSENHKITEEKCFQYIEKIIKTLLDSGADVKSVDHEGKTALLHAARISGAGSILQCLLASGSKVNHVDSDKNSALYIAVAEDRFENATLLIKSGAVVNQRCRSDRTPLHKAVKISEAMVRLLLENNANVEAIEKNGNTPLLKSIGDDDDSEVIVDLLIQAGAKVNHQNKVGESALMKAAGSVFSSDSVKLLLRAHANVNSVTTDMARPKTALSAVLNKWHHSDLSQSLAMDLLDHGATIQHLVPGVIHRLIAVNGVTLVKKLISQGLGPGELHLTNLPVEWPDAMPVSSLAIALVTDNVPMARHFIDTWYLTSGDLSILSGNPQILHYVEDVCEDSCALLKDKVSQPLSLVTLAFVHVSSAIGCGADRGERVKKTQLPFLLQERLLFHNNEEANSMPSEDYSYYENDHLLHVLAKTTDSNEKDFYNFDETFKKFIYKSATGTLFDESDDSSD
ncbi:unnamed protein product [Lymnaea stagnalis]|uniref:ANK_REP_REGION domain-containing protein n=1 Tax=Lymnaea stagnalis TaxID=6523 RepID=A0AAV2I5Y5_LYMST